MAIIIVAVVIVSATVLFVLFRLAKGDDLHDRTRTFFAQSCQVHHPTWPRYVPLLWSFIAALRRIAHWIHSAM